MPPRCPHNLLCSFLLSLCIPSKHLAGGLLSGFLAFGRREFFTLLFCQCFLALKGPNSACCVCHCLLAASRRSPKHIIQGYSGNTGILRIQRMSSRFLRLRPHSVYTPLFGGGEPVLRRWAFGKRTYLSGVCQENRGQKEI